MMTIQDIRAKYLEYFKRKGHAIIPSASLVPENDPTTLFTGSGMQPLLPYLLGKNHPLGTRLANSQKSFRAMDIEEVGDNRHTTFFEMLGNWSFGDYFKEEQLPFFFEFLTKEVGLDPKRLYVSVFLGDEKNGIARDTESVAIWKELFGGHGIEARDAVMGSEEEGGKRGIKEGERIFFYDATKNWWSRSGTPEKMPAGEPGGPDSEVFYCFEHVEHDMKFGPNCHPNCDCGRFLEIGNSVFMQYIKQEDGSFALLPKRNVDFGGGLERIAAAKNNDPDVFRVAPLSTVIAALEKAGGKTYGINPKDTKAFRIVTDHIRGATFMLADGVRPSNTERGYILRRLLRRAVRYADTLGIPAGKLAEVAAIVIENYAEAYPELTAAKTLILKEISTEESRFRETLARGMKETQKLALMGNISGKDAATLFTTYGFPIELTEELAREAGVTVDMDGFHKEMKKHQELSRAGSEQKFKGGLADTEEKTVRLHTAHHLLLRALQIVLGPEVHQRGSNITQERLRIDFSYGAKMTDEQKAEVERIVNEKITEGLPVIRSEMSREKAEELGAEHEFGQKYPEMVSVYSIGPKDATPEDPKFAECYSIEFCGGPHVSNTSELGRFRIQKEEAVAQGIRRIKAILEPLT
jgi:alanyl-tRNA synthetase